MFADPNYASFHLHPQKLLVVYLLVSYRLVGNINSECRMTRKAAGLAASPRLYLHLASIFIQPHMRCAGHARHYRCYKKFVLPRLIWSRIVIFRTLLARNFSIVLSGISLAQIVDGKITINQSSLIQSTMASSTLTLPTSLSDMTCVKHHRLI